MHKGIWYQTVFKNKTSQSWRRIVEIIKYRGDEWLIKGHLNTVSGLVIQP